MANIGIFNKSYRGTDWLSSLVANNVVLHTTPYPGSVDVINFPNPIDPSNVALGIQEYSTGLSLLMAPVNVLKWSVTLVSSTSNSITIRPQLQFEDTISVSTISFETAKLTVCIIVSYV